MPTTKARTRADDLQLFAELNGVDTFVANMTLATEDFVLRAEYENVTASTAGESGLTSQALADRLWEGDYDDDPDYVRAQARAALVTSKLCMFLLSDGGRSFLQKEAIRLIAIAEGLLGEAERQADDA